MILQTTFTNGKDRKGIVSIKSTKIPLTELNQITQTKLSAETIVALLNEKENLYSLPQKNSKKWSICRHCQKIFIHYRKDTGNYCSKSCCGKAKDWLKNYSANGLGKKCPAKGLKLEKNPAWKGGVTYWRKHGNYKPIKYVRCPKEFLPMARKDGYVMEHRLIVAQSLGICLERTQVVHHINHDPQDNRLENLMLFQSNKEHKLYEGQELRKLNTQG